MTGHSFPLMSLYILFSNRHLIFSHITVTLLYTETIELTDTRCEYITSI
jgi:hypothetical protein